MIGASVDPGRVLVPGSGANPNENDEPRAEGALLGEKPVRAVVSVEMLRLAGLEVAPTPMRPAIADKRSSISTGIFGAGGFGRNNAPSVVFPREGLLEGGNTTDDRAELGVAADAAAVDTEPARGGGRGRGAHPVRRGRGLIAGRGEDAGVGDEALWGDPADAGGEEGSTAGIEVFAKLAGAEGADGDDEEWSVAIDVGGVMSISTVSPRSLEVTN